MAVNYGSLPFQEQIDFFRSKVNLPTQAWTDLWHGMHARGFVVAGAMRDDLLADLRTAVDKAISQGTTLAEFRRDFDALVARHGWTYNGGRNWRTRVIYETNLRTSYMTGRYHQMQAVKQTRPFWRYRHAAGEAHPRPQHQAWNGITLHADDPWWDTHFTPNGWGCKCTIETLSERDLKRLGKDGPDTAPPLDEEDVTVGKNGPSPRTVRVPKGIDPGWAYNPGKAAWGREPAKRIIDKGPFEEVDGWGPEKYPHLPAKLPVVEPPVEPGPSLHDAEELRQALPVGNYRDVTGAEISVSQAIVDHILEAPDKRWNGREQYFPLIPSILQHPAEVWYGFIRYEDGRYAIRRRYLVAYQLPGKKRVAGVLVDTEQGYLVAMDVFHGSNLKGGRLRFGRLAYAAKDE